MERRDVVVAGDVRLSYLVSDGLDGGGRMPAGTVVCLPGWSQAAEQFEGLARHLAPRPVLALDHRGHGGSSHPRSGYRVHRLAADLREVLVALDLRDVTLLGHSMGVAVTYAYLELFGTDRLARLVLADQRPALLVDPAWSDAERADAGATQTAQALFDLCHRLRGPDGWDVLVDILRRMTSPDLPPDRLAALAETNRPTTGAVRAALWFDQSTLDWRDLVPTVTLPALVVHGLGSMVPLSCQQWTADALPHGSLATVPAEAGGSHFAFWEAPATFSGTVAGFLDG